MILNYRYCALMLAVLVAGLSTLPMGNQSCAQNGAGFESQVTAASGANANSGGGGIAPQTCDTQVWQTMEMRAKLETEREVMQNQSLIFKPDSILAYTCFDKFAEHAAAYGGVLFTHTKYWGEEIIPWGDEYGMDGAIKKVVLASMKTYIESNFKYSQLGDRGKDIDGASGMDIYETSQKGKDSYACARMAQVWKTAKCLNFVHNKKFSDLDGFYPFINMKAHGKGQDIKGYEEYKDVRKYPADMDCKATAPVDQNTWLVAYRKSRDEDNGFGDMNRFYDFGIPLTDVFKAVREKVDPIGDGVKCADPVLTGITVIESAASGSDQPYADGVCTNPGCVFIKSGTTGKCEEAK